MEDKNQGASARNIKNIKKRNWAFILYPESAPENWREIIRDEGPMAAISPLHDKDIDENGKQKKPHYHVMLCWRGPASYRLVTDLVSDRLNQPIPKPVGDVRSYYLYLTHKNAPEKAQYDEASIEVINNFDIRIFNRLEDFERNDIVKRLTNLIVEEKIVEYLQFMMRVQREDAPPEWFDVASNRTIYFTNIIRSHRHTLENELKNQPRRRKD